LPFLLKSEELVVFDDAHMSLPKYSHFHLIKSASLISPSPVASPNNSVVGVLLGGMPVGLGESVGCVVQLLPNSVGIHVVSAEKISLSTFTPDSFPMSFIICEPAVRFSVTLFVFTPSLKSVHIQVLGEKEVASPTLMLQLLSIWRKYELFMVSGAIILLHTIYSLVTGRVIDNVAIPVFVGREGQSIGVVVCAETEVIKQHIKKKTAKTTTKWLRMRKYFIVLWCRMEIYLSICVSGCGIFYILLFFQITKSRSSTVPFLLKSEERIVFDDAHVPLPKYSHFHRVKSVSLTSPSPVASPGTS
jgi:hypothetical protein